jgi:hypothetical protein
MNQQASVATSPAAPTPRSINKLKNVEQFRLWNYLQDLHVNNKFTLQCTKQSLAASATTALGFRVTDHNIQGAFETLSISLPQPPVSAEAALKRRVDHLEAMVRMLCTELNVPCTLGY